MLAATLSTSRRLLTARAPGVLSSLAQSVRDATTLVVSEPPPSSGPALPPSTLSAVTAAAKFGHPITLLVVAPEGFTVDTSHVPPEVSSVVTAHTKGGEHTHLLSETVAEAVKAATEANTDDPYTHIVAAHTKFGSSYVPRVGALLGVSPVPDVVDILDEETFVRPIYAGNALAKVKSTDSPLRVLSVRPTAFEKADASAGSPSASVSDLDVPTQSLTEWLGESVTKSDRPDLGSASVVVSGGRGMKSGENFVILEKLADKLGGAVGASRAAVDAGFVPNDMQVGQTGKVVAPDLYIAVGISGAIQHLSGMKDSKVIVAVNKDAEAPIFQVADYGLVADLFNAVPELTEKV
eukprot:CAMPEP_0113596632 /NCGR_PEP_ID=MMETSP0015_2-20120614/40459_1 /TAXON_ID=2838 /ORGANISM="Odontella" /LENGTH=350 /DNA_ID=CAMNT_0000504199 /DNA_START=168 /DNA_END=1220 /DNA_ORIENTATION=+ /assembly_acc=CAM_ASM_000160